VEITELLQEIKAPTTIVHVVAVIFGMGSALVSDVLFSFFSKDKKLNKTEIYTLTILRNIISYSLVFIIFSGIIIFLSDIAKYTNSAKFLAKMSIMVVLLLNGHVLNKYIWPHLLNKNFFTLKKERNIRRLAFACGAVSVISWLLVCTLGILDSLDMSYSLIILNYILILTAGIIISLIVERKEFN